jgi:8-oxo-dGTP diphosphatase
MKKRVRAIITQDGKLLAIRRAKANETYWVFPGGGAEPGENDEQTLVRECKEELGLDVKVGKYFADDIFQWNGEPEDILFYECEIVGGELGTGDGLEYQENNGYDGTHEIEWLEVSNLSSVDLRPHHVRDMIKK